MEGDSGGTPCPLRARVSLFGTLHLHDTDGAERPITNKRARALLGMLCLSREEPLDREQLSKLLWPDRFEGHARASLRQCLLDLGKLLADCAPGALITARGFVSLDRSSLATDLGELEAALHEGRAEQAIGKLTAAGTQPLLAGLPVGEELGRWLAAQRALVEARLGHAVEGALAELAHGGSWVQHAALLAAWSARASALGTGERGKAEARQARIAVLPFALAHASAGQDYLADGLVDELITTLGRLPELRVTGRTSSFHFRGSALPLPDIAAALHVTHLIEGCIQRSGEQLRVHVHLIDGATGFERWAQRFEGRTEELFTLQDRIAEAVSAAVGATLDVALAPLPTRGLTRSKEAYDLYLQGRALIARLLGDGVLDSARALLEQAVEIDPDFAEAWLLLGELHQLVAIYTACLDRPAAGERMARCVERALAIKPTLGQAYLLLALHQITRNDFLSALDLAHQGFALAPDDPQASMRLGAYLLMCGRTGDGLHYLERAIAQDPIDGRKHMLRCIGELNRGNIAKAQVAGQRAVDLGAVSIYLGVASAAAGQHDLAVSQYMQTRLLLNKSIFPPAGTVPMSGEAMDAYWLVAARGVCSGKAEDRDHYCRTLDLLHLTMHDKGDQTITLPAVFMGYADMLFQTIGERITPGNFSCLLSIWADVEPIRRIWNHPHFLDFARSIGMAAAWDKYGWPDLLPVPGAGAPQDQVAEAKSA